MMTYASMYEKIERAEDLVWTVSLEGRGKDSRVDIKIQAALKALQEAVEAIREAAE